MKVIDNKFLNITVFKSKDGKTCVYSFLQNVGLPEIKDIQHLEGKGLQQKVHIWLNSNWTGNTQLTKQFVSIVLQVKSGSIKSFPVRSDIAKAAFKGVIQFMNENFDQLLHLSHVYFPADVTLAGTPVPKISKQFNSMSYADRQKILMENRTRIEETN